VADCLWVVASGVDQPDLLELSRRRHAVDSGLAPRGVVASLSSQEGNDGCLWRVVFPVVGVSWLNYFWLAALMGIGHSSLVIGHRILDFRFWILD
jgi:hypothetical protein